MTKNSMGQSSNQLIYPSLNTHTLLSMVIRILEKDCNATGIVEISTLSRLGEIQKRKHYWQNENTVIYYCESDVSYPVLNHANHSLQCLWIKKWTNKMKIYNLN